MKFINEEVNPNLGKSILTIWLNSYLNIRQTLASTLTNPLEKLNPHPILKMMLGIMNVAT